VWLSPACDLRFKPFFPVEQSKERTPCSRIAAQLAIATVPYTALSHIVFSFGFFSSGTFPHKKSLLNRRLSSAIGIYLFFSLIYSQSFLSVSPLPRSTESLLTVVVCSEILLPLVDHPFRCLDYPALKGTGSDSTKALFFGADATKPHDESPFFVFRFFQLPPPVPNLSEK